MKLHALLCSGLLFVGIFAGPVAAQSSPTTKKGDEGIDGLIQVLITTIRAQDEDDEIRGSAAEALVYLGRPAVPALVKGLEGQDKKFREQAAYILMGMGNQAWDALPAFAKILKNKDEEKVMRRLAAAAIAEILKPPAKDNGRTVAKHK